MYIDGINQYLTCAQTNYFDCTDLPCQSNSQKKEVIQPHLPVRLPCYDFILVIGSDFVVSRTNLEYSTSVKTNFKDVTGGVYKT